jgi:hypothetical protein
MDVSAAYADMNDYVTLGDYESAAEIARNIKRWVRAGGFVPAGHNTRSIYAECNKVIELAC